jgi:hypothetical protein
MNCSATHMPIHLQHTVVTGASSTWKNAHTLALRQNSCALVFNTVINFWNNRKVFSIINQSINVTSVALKFIENSCQPFTKNHLVC